MTAPVEHDDGRFEVLGYDDFRRPLSEQARERLADDPRRDVVRMAVGSMPA